MEENILKTQRENFRRFMNNHNLNASSWAKKSGVSEATIRHYLSGRNKSITALNLEKLAKSINVDSDLILHPSKKQGRNARPTLQKDLFIQTFSDVNEFIKSEKLDLTPVIHAKILFSWYELAYMSQETKSLQSIDSFKDMIRLFILSN